MLDSPQSSSVKTTPVQTNRNYSSDAVVYSLIKELNKVGNNLNNIEPGVVRLPSTTTMINGVSSAVTGKQQTQQNQHNQHQPQHHTITTSTPNNNSNIWGKNTVWGSPQSPSPSSIGTQYFTSSSHSNSKESLWASTQSSPTSNIREQFIFNSGHHQNNSASKPDLNLWDNPVSKIPQAQLMESTSSTNSNIWQIHSPSINKHSLYESVPNIINQQQHLLRPHEIGSDLWNPNVQQTNSNNQIHNPLPNHHHNNHNKNPHQTSNSNYMSKLLQQPPPSTLQLHQPLMMKEPVGSIWATPTSNNNNNNCNNNKLNIIPTNSVKSLRFSPPPPPIITTTHQHLNQNQQPLLSQLSQPPPPIIHQSLMSNSNNINTNNNNNAIVNNSTASTAADSSCLQLLSDEFLYYLTMIN